MRPGFELARVLITVLTYPQPSVKDLETVCTAGITEAGKWVRLYPVNYRSLPREKRYRKWQWIEVALGPWGYSNDQRVESREPDVSSIRLLGEPISPKGNWRERRALIDGMSHHTVRELDALYDTSRVSLGIVRPTAVLDLEVASGERDWDPKHQALRAQGRLFDERKPLQRIPFTFHYVFECKDSQERYRLMNVDWELGVLFLKERERLSTEVNAIRSVREKFLGEICASDRDTRFFLGTRHPFKQWLVIGAFWPPRDYIPGGLFTHL